MGCETWAISTTASKEAEARKFGAAALLVSSDAAAMTAQVGTATRLMHAAAPPPPRPLLCPCARTLFRYPRMQKGTFDFILCTAAAAFDVGAYLKLLKPRRSFCLVGLPAVATPLKVRPSGTRCALSTLQPLLPGPPRRSSSPLTSLTARRPSLDPCGYGRGDVESSTYEPFGRHVMQDRRYR